MAVITPGLKSTAQELLSTIASKWTSTSDGGLQASDIRIGSYEAALVQLLNLDSTDLLPSEFQIAASRAVRRMCKAGHSSTDDYEDAFLLERAEIVKKKRTKHVALTRCFFGAHGPFEMKLKLWDHSAILTKEPDEKFDLSDFFISGYGDVRLRNPSFGAYLVTGPLMARSTSAALDLANESNRVILGLVAFWMNLGKFSIFVGHERPLTKIIPGKEIVIFDANFSRNEDFVSYYVTTPDKCETIGGSTLERLRSTEKVFADISKVHKTKRDYITSFLKLYYDAVSEQSSHDQITKLWKAAEYATFSQGSSTEQIAKRIAVVSHDFDMTFAICTAVGHRRHQIVHNEKPSQHMTEIVEVFRGILENFFRIPLSNKIPTLKGWRAALEVGSGRYSQETLQSALPILDLFKSPEA